MESSKEREHRTTRKAALSMELKDQGLQQVDQKAEEDKKSGGKKKAAEASQAAKGEILSRDAEIERLRDELKKKDEQRSGSGVARGRSSPS